DPGLAGRWIDLLLQQGQAQSAREAAERLVSALGEDAEALFFLAKAQFACADLAAARQSATRLELLGAARFSAFHEFMASLHAASNDHDAMLAAWERALAIDPANAHLWQRLGEARRRRGELQQAAQAWRQWARSADSAEAWWRTGVVEQGAGEVSAAALSFANALQRDPGSTRVLRSAATLAAETFDFPAARLHLSRLLELDPGDEAARDLLGFVLAEIGEYEAARGMLAVAPPAGQSMRPGRRLRADLLLPQIPESAEQIDALRHAYADALARLSATRETWCPDARSVFEFSQTNFLLAYHARDDRPLQESYAALLRALIREARPDLLERRMPRARGRIKVVFVSSFFRQCTIGNYFASWITGLDARRFERVVYYTGWEPDAFGRRLEAAADRFVLARGSAQQVAEALRDERADIIVYPEVGMGAQNYLLVNMRLAPLQCAGWGHPVTTGSAEIDAYFSCAAMEPLDHAAQYSEPLVLLPGIGTRYEMPPGVPAVERAALGIDASAHLYVCPQSLFKIHPDNDELYVELMARDRRAVLLFFQASYPALNRAFAERIARRMSARGLQPRGQFKLLPRQSESGFRAIVGAADVMLDTLGWSGGNTSLDALAVGTPIVTLPGEFMRGRQTMAMLRLAGCEELIARDAADWLEIAGEVAADRARNARLRKHLLEERGAVFDREEPVAALAERLEGLVRSA
ncbi:MAG TPA: hypothetical protein VFV17_09785, partial [Usitatibacteraceae bacterium]|nr:hypothetical protein [Usitatibacteraceae bacterium]